MVKNCTYSSGGTILNLKRLIILVTPFLLLTLAGCESSNTDKRPSKSEVHQNKVDKASKTFVNSPSDGNYLKYLQAELGANHVGTVRHSPHKYAVTMIKKYTFSSEKQYKKFGKSMQSILSVAKRTNYAKGGLGFIQHKKDGDTAFTFAYSKKDIKDGELSKSALKNDYDPVFENATSFYIEPFFKQDTKNNIMTDSDVNAGPIVGPDKKSLNTEIMETFDE